MELKTSLSFWTLLWSTIKKSCFLQSYFCNVLEHFTCPLASDADVLRLVARDKSTCLFAGRLFQDLVCCGERSSKDWGLLKELWDHQGSDIASRMLFRRLKKSILEESALFRRCQLISGSDSSNAPWEIFKTLSSCFAYHYCPPILECDDSNEGFLRNNSSIQCYLLFKIWMFSYIKPFSSAMVSAFLKGKSSVSWN